jgi:hypothetical protein
VAVGRRPIPMLAVRHGRGALGMREDAEPGEPAPGSDRTFCAACGSRVRGDLDPHACDLAGIAVVLLVQTGHWPVPSARAWLTLLRHGALGQVARKRSAASPGGWSARRSPRPPPARPPTCSPCYLQSVRLAEQVTRAAHGWPRRPSAGLSAGIAGSGQRLILRRKTYALARCAPRETAVEPDAMDYNIHLVLHADTGQDAAICRVGFLGSVAFGGGVHPTPRCPRSAR